MIQQQIHWVCQPTYPGALAYPMDISPERRDPQLNFTEENQFSQEYISDDRRTITRLRFVQEGHCKNFSNRTLRPTGRFTIFKLSALLVQEVVAPAGCWRSCLLLKVVGDVLLLLMLRLRQQRRELEEEVDASAAVGTWRRSRCVCCGGNLKRN